jgi:hypothetical protein
VPQWTFAVPGDGSYLRSVGSIDDLVALAVDTELEIVEPLHVLASVEIADLRPPFLPRPRAGPSCAHRRPRH